MFSKKTPVSELVARAKQQAETGEKPVSRDHVCARQAGNLKLIPVKDIYFFQSDAKYTIVNHANGCIAIEQSLTSLEEQHSHFMRIHRNCIVDKNLITEFKKIDNLFYVVIAGHQLQVSRRNISTVRKFVRDMA